MPNNGGPEHSSPVSPIGQPQTVQKKESYLSMALYMLVALGLAILIRVFIAEPFVVDGTSMLNTFQNLNYLIVDRVSYDFSEPQRGDVVVLELPQETSRDLIKRVIGLPGDTVAISGSQPTITIYNTQYPDGCTLSEPYVDSANYGGPTDIRVTLGANQYYVLGDNRNVSADSRTWGILPGSDIVGRVLLRLYPFNEVEILPGEARYSQCEATSTHANTAKSGTTNSQ